MMAAHVEAAVGAARCVAVYLPIGSEADPLPLIDRLSAHGITLALPHVRGRRDMMRFLAWAPGDALVAGPMGLRQPDESAPETVPDAIVAPLLAFDARLNRLGYGAGHYDRAFAQHPDARRIGLAWHCQRVDVLPIDPWDVPLHGVATEQGWIAA